MIQYGNIGARDLKIVIQSPSYSRDLITNEKFASWSNFATVWAEVITPIRKLIEGKESTSNESFEVKQQVAKKNYNFKIKYLDGVDETMRVLVGDEINYITGIDYVGRKSYLVLKTEQRDNVNSTSSQYVESDSVYEDEGIDGGTSVETGGDLDNIDGENYGGDINGGDV